jgi:hypothetical protein
MRSLLQFTRNVYKSHRQPQCTLQLVCEDRVLVIWVDIHVSRCRQAESKMWARNLFHVLIHLCFVNFALNAMPRKPWLTGIEGQCMPLSNTTISVTWNKSINQIAIQHNYLLYICGGNMFRLLSVSHHQALHNFQTTIWRSAIDDGIPLTHWRLTTTIVAVPHR